MFRYFIYLSFDGTNYHGWQIQPNGVTIQGVLNDTPSCAGRLKWWGPDVRMPVCMRG